MAVLLAWTRGGSTFAPLAIGLAVFVILGALSDLAERINLFRASLAVSLRRAKGLPRSAWGTVFAHAGLGVALIGIVCETTWNTEYIASLKTERCGAGRWLQSDVRGYDAAAAIQLS